MELKRETVLEITQALTVLEQMGQRAFKLRQTLCDLLDADDARVLAIDTSDAKKQRVRCNGCGWHGFQKQLAPTPDGQSYMCPNCGWLGLTLGEYAWREAGTDLVKGSVTEGIKQ